MKIGYDGKRAVLNFTGLGNYSRLIVESIAQAQPSWNLEVYTPRTSDNPRLAAMLAQPNVAIRTPDTPLGRTFGSLWRSYGLTAQLRRDDVALFHGLSGELPLNIAKAGIPSVLTIHDLIFRRYPQYYKPIDRTIYDYKFRRSAHAATRIIAICERTRQDIFEFYGVDPGKIDVIYQGCDKQFLRDVPVAEVAEVAERYHLPQRYVVTVGTVEHRKNQLLAVKALPYLDPDIKLVIVGRRTDYARELEAYAAANSLTDRLIWLEGVPFNHLPALYAGAMVSTYTSRYEGFGIPVIESIGVGTPCVVATGSCLEEAGGPDTVAVDPDDAEALAHAIKAKAGTAAPRDYIKRFDTERFTNQIIETYKKAIDQYGNNRN